MHDSESRLSRQNIGRYEWLMGFIVDIHGRFVHDVKGDSGAPPPIDDSSLNPPHASCRHSISVSDFESDSDEEAEVSPLDAHAATPNRTLSSVSRIPRPVYPRP